MINVIETAKQECSESIRQTVKQLYNLDVDPKVEVDFQHGRKADASSAIAFQLAGKLKKKPDQISQEIAVALTLHSLVEKAECLNGFVNFTFSQEYFTKALVEASASKEGFEKAVKKKGTVIVEYSCPNVGKPLHVGHIRGTIFGHALKNIYQQVGYKVVSFNYLGDSGSQVAKLLLALEIYKDLPEIKTEKDLLAYYVKINEEVEKSEELKKRQREILEAIENGDKKVQAGLDKVRKLSITAFNNSYDTLGVEFDEVIGESAFVKDAKKLVQEAVDSKSKVAFKDKGGEIVAALEPQIPNTILMRSNGTTLYLARDLALADYKFSKYTPIQSINITGNEQNTHFRQVYAILQKLGRNYNNKHIGFGLLTFGGKKLATREGTVILLADIIEEAKQEAKEQIMQREPELKGKELEARSLAIGLAALKFAVLKVSQEKNIVFDFKQMTSFEGDTGAYLQYSLVRCKSILEKAKTFKKTKTEPWLNEEEKELLMILSAYPVVLQNAANSLSPHTLCDYLLKTAASFSKFYSLHSVLNAEDEETKATRLLLVKATGNVLEHGLEILGITTLKKM